jgi:hypothetical protein
MRGRPLVNAVSLCRALDVVASNIVAYSPWGSEPPSTRAPETIGPGGRFSMTRPIRFIARSGINASLGTVPSIARACMGLLVGLFPTVLYNELVARVPALPRWPFALPFFSLLACGLLPTRIRLTDEGMRIAWIGSRFIPYDQVVTASLSGRDVSLGLAGGRTVRLPIGRRRDRRDDCTRANELLLALQERLAQFRLTRDVRTSIGRGGRDVNSWATHLCRPFREGPFRTPTPSAEILWLLLEDHAAPPDVRVGAAVALRLMTRATDDQGVRIETIAKASDPRVRAYIDAVSTWEGDAGSLAQILLPLAPNTEPARLESMSKAID